MNEPISSDCLSAECRTYLVAAAVVSLIPGSTTLFTAQIFGGMIEEQFHKEGVEFLNCGAFFGQGFMVAVLTVREVKPCLGVLFRVLENRKPLNRYPREIAYFDPDEAFWRTVYPAPAGAPFDRFLSPEILAANQDECQSNAALFKALLHYSHALNQESGDATKTP